MNHICPKCGHGKFIVQGGAQEVRFAKRWWLFGHSVARIRMVEVHAACAACFYAVVLFPGGWREAMTQTAHDALMRVQGQIAAAASEPAANGEKPPERKATPMPRPAPDPRVRRR